MKEICLCTMCREMLYESDQLAQHIKWERGGEPGEVDYIELAHVKCAIAYNTERPGYFELP